MLLVVCCVMSCVSVEHFVLCNCSLVSMFPLPFPPSPSPPHSRLSASVHSLSLCVLSTRPVFRCTVPFVYTPSCLPMLHPVYLCGPAPSSDASPRVMCPVPSADPRAVYLDCVLFGCHDNSCGSWGSPRHCDLSLPPPRLPGLPLPHRLHHPHPPLPSVHHPTALHRWLRPRSLPLPEAERR